MTQDYGRVPPLFPELDLIRGDLETAYREIRRLRARLEALSAGDSLRATAIPLVGPASGGTGVAGSILGSVTIWTNNSGAAKTQGTVVVRAGDRLFNSTTTQDDANVIGVLDDASVANGADGRIRHNGYQTAVKTQGVVTAGHYLRASTTDDRAEDAGASPSSGTFGVALTASAGGASTVAAYLFPMTHAATPTVDASAVTFTPAVNADWTGAADPGNADDAFDQLASRLTTVEGAGGGGGGGALATMLSDPTSAAWSNQPAALTELFGGTNNRTKIDLSAASTVRLVVDVQTVGVAGAKLRAQYSTDESTWAYLDGATGPEVAIDATGTVASAVVNLTAAAKADVWVRVVGISGDGAADPAFGVIQLQFDTINGFDLAHQWLPTNFFAENYPASPTAYDDEFDDTTGNSGTVNGLDARWAWRNQGTATATYAKAGYAAIAVPASAVVNWRILEQTAPAGDWTIETKISLEGIRTQYVNGGLVAIDGTNGDLYSFGIAFHTSGKLSINGDRWTNATTFNATVVTPIVIEGINACYLRMKYVSAGATLQYWYSLDGVAWVRIQAAFADAVGVTKFGIGIDEENNSGLSVAYFDYFRKVA